MPRSTTWTSTPRREVATWRGRMAPVMLSAARRARRTTSRHSRPARITSSAISIRRRCSARSSWPAHSDLGARSHPTPRMAGSAMSVPRPEASSIPDAPGAYLFRDSDGRVVYAGKAISLRKRLASYWGRPLHPRTEAMMAAAAQVEWIVASTEVDALMLEYNLIKAHKPRFNVRYRDDKSYPYLALTVGEKWPRARVMRGARQKGVRYFGPFGHAYAIRETLDALTRVFPVRTCSNSFFDQRARARRPCLYYDIGRCSGPCVPEATGVTEEEYRLQVEALGEFLSGKYAPALSRLEAEMREV